MYTRRRLRRRTLSLEIADALRDMILQRELTAGQRLNHEQLAETLGVSTMPVREALVNLVHEGFVEVSPSRILRVRPITRQDIQDMYWVHAKIAGELARRAAAHADQTMTVSLRQHVEALETALAVNDVTAMNHESWEFHRLVNKAANAPQLLFILRGILGYIPSHFYPRVHEWRSAAVEGHQQILEAIEQRDPDRAKQVAEHHIRQIGDLLVAYFGDEGFWNLDAAVPDADGKSPNS